MKILKYLFVAALAAFAAVSCAKADEEPIHRDNLISNIQIVQGGTSVQPITGRIDEQTGTILFQVTKKYRPLYPDLTRLAVSASTNYDAMITPSLTGLKDLTEPFAITVTSGTGEVRHYTLQAYYSRQDE